MIVNSPVGLMQNVTALSTVLRQQALKLLDVLLLAAGDAEVGDDVSPGAAYEYRIFDGRDNFVVDLNPRSNSPEGVPVSHPGSEPIAPKVANATVGGIRLLAD